MESPIVVSSVSLRTHKGADVPVSSATADLMDHDRFISVSLESDVPREW